MCGISGFIDPNIKQDSREAVITGMLSSLNHRGPDNKDHITKGPLTLGHNRLSIIDLNAQAHQPMRYNHLIITYNGEIYNYLELKAELQQKGYNFSTDSDTEVILAAYQAWGVACVEYFIGMWSFAIWDDQKEELFCSRDRFGIKPFFFIHEGRKFYFGSEAKALRQTPVFSNTINTNQASVFLQLGWIYYNEHTLLEKIKTLPAGYNLYFKKGNISLHQYWNLNDEIQKQDNDNSSVNFRDLFLESMKLHQRSDVEIGGCLSGGLDSSSISSAFCYLNPETEFKTFTIYYSGKGEKDIDETPWARKVIDKYPGIKAFYYSPSNDDIVNDFSNFAHHMDFPSAGSSPFSQYFVMKLAHQNQIKVLLDGQGADEYLGGYNHSFYRFFADYLLSGNLTEFGKQFYAYQKLHKLSYQETGVLLGKTLLASFMSEHQLYSLEYKKMLPFLAQQKTTPFKLNGFNGNKLKNFFSALIQYSSLPTLLHNEDRNSMAFSIESRVPFLDHRLVVHALKLNNEEIINKGVTKNILRNSLKDINPTSITKRHDKKGFITPGEVKWLRGPLSHLVTKDFRNLDFLNKKEASRLTDGYLKGDNSNAKLVWRLSTLKHWLHTI